MTQQELARQTGFVFSYDALQTQFEFAPFVWGQRGGSGGGFTPASVPGFLGGFVGTSGLYQDASATTLATGTDPVGAWVNYFDPTSKLTQVTSGKRGTRSGPGVLFTEDQWLSLPSPLWATARSVLAVCAAPAASGGQSYGVAAGGNTGLQCVVTNSLKPALVNGGSGNVTVANEVVYGIDQVTYVANDALDKIYIGPTECTYSVQGASNGLARATAALGNTPDGALTGEFPVHAALFYSQPVSAANVLRLRNWVQGVLSAGVQPQLVLNGNSLLEGTAVAPPGDFPTIMALGVPTTTVNNLAHSGQTTAQMLASTQQQNAYTLLVPKNVMLVNEDINDLSIALRTPAQCESDMAGTCLKNRRLGYKVAVTTPCPRTDDGNYTEAHRQEVIALRRANWPNYADALVDLAANPLIGAVGANLDEAYYVPGGVHWNEGGNRVAVSVALPVLATLGLIVLAAPSNTVLPVVTGDPTDGHTLTTSTGTFVPTPDAYAYRWFADGVTIPGETASTLLLTEGQVGALITSGVTASGLGGDSAEAVSVTVGPVEESTFPFPTNWWRLATNPNDFGSSGDNLTPSGGGVTYGPGYAHLDGTDTLESDPGVANATGSFTSTGWFWLDSTGNASLWGTNFAVGGWQATTESAKIDNWFYNGASRKIAQKPYSQSSGTWFFLTLVYDAATETGYADLNNSGSPVSIALTAPLDIGGVAAFLVGADVSGLGNLVGRVKLIGYWDGVILTADELTQLYGGGTPFDPTV